MSTIKVFLKKIKFSNQTVTVPYWFTLEKNNGKPFLHLSASTNPLEIIDLQTTPVTVLKEIYTGVLSGDITSDNIDALLEHLGLAVAGTSTKKEVKAPIDEKSGIVAQQTKTEDKKEDIIIKKATELLSLSQTKLIDIVGPAQLAGGVIPSGIMDIDILSMMATLELKENSRPPRKKVLSMLEKRIELLKENTDYNTVNIPAVQGNALVITDEPETDIFINKTGTETVLHGTPVTENTEDKE